jgi:hypothetical protein
MNNINEDINDNNERVNHLQTHVTNKIESLNKEIVSN